MVLFVNAEERLRARIAWLLQEYGTKHVRFAKAAGRKGPWASMYLKGKRSFPLDRLDSVAQLFHLTPAELFQDEAVRGSPAVSAQRGVLV